MKYSQTFILTGFSLLALNACSPTTTTAGAGSSGGLSSTWSKAVQKNYSGLSSANISDLNNLSIPTLKSASLTAKWGAPKVEKSASSYRLSYADPKQPFRRVVIYGMSKPLPALSSAPKYSGEDMVNGELTGFTRSQSWRTPINIAGKSVRWFMESAGGGADGAYYSTEGFSATSNGKSGFYRVVVESGEGASAEKEIASWLKSISL